MQFKIKITLHHSEFPLHKSEQALLCKKYYICIPIVDWNHFWLTYVQY